MKFAELKEAGAAEVGHALAGFGVNLLVRDVGASCDFLREVFGFCVVRADANYGLLEFRGRLFQVHQDATYAGHPLYEMVGQPPRGVRVELQLYECDPDECERRAVAGGYVVLQAAKDKPHGLREVFILDGDGYCWVASGRV